MRIQHNIMAMNAYRNYNNNVSSLSKNLEKLSSGYRINRAGDDAAGLAISEKMRAQITGLDAAQKNVKDGVSLVKTAEGALQEVQDMMNRMVYLAEQSANGTYDVDVDRKALQEEVNALTEEIDRIAKSANFNGQKLLNGELAGPAIDTTNGKGKEAAVSAQKATGTFTAVASLATNDTVKIGNTTYTVVATVTNASTQIKNTAVNSASKAAAVIKGKLATEYAAYSFSNTGGTIKFEQKTAADLASGTELFAVEVKGADLAETISKAGRASKASVAGTKALTTVDFTDLDGSTVVGGTLTVDGKTYEFAANSTSALADANNVRVVVTTSDTASGVATKLATAINASGSANIGTTDDKFQAAAAGTTLKIEEATTNGTTATNALKVETKNLGGMVLQIGDTSDTYNRLNVSIDSMLSADLFGGTIDISKQGLAQTALNTVKDAINTVSAQRGRLGAIQNRLEHTQNNLSVMKENITDAESSIRDTDVADEMMKYTKNNILIQSAQAMLAQANAVPQGVLQLLQ